MHRRNMHYLHFKIRLYDTTGPLFLLVLASDGFTKIYFNRGVTMRTCAAVGICKETRSEVAIEGMFCFT